jgi:Coenzyme PQQ synthesis protein D (PqqD)
MSDKYISRSTAVAARELGGEMIIMSAVDSTLFSLNETATVIWQAADGKTPLLAIVESQVCSQFHVQTEEAYRDALELVDELSRYGLLLLSDEPAVDEPLETVNNS